MRNKAFPALEYRPDLDGLRAIAVLAVVAAHARIPLLHGGFIGVDIFFVLSGYLITSIIARDIELGSFSMSAFYERRARRILPALFFMLFSVLVAGYLLFPPWQYEQFAKTMSATAVSVSNIQLMNATGDYFSANADYQPLLHTWSLAVEEQFYLLYPPLLMLAYRAGFRWVIFAVSALCLVSFSLTMNMMSSEQDQAFFLPHLRAWELGAGALLALLRLPAVPSRGVATAMGGAGFLIIGACALSYDKATPFPGLAALPIVLGTVLLIHSGKTPGSAFARLLALGPNVWVGKISYSLYLWHWPPIVALYTLTAGSPEPEFVGGVVFFSFIAAWLSWRFVEKPFRGKWGASGFSRARIFWLSGIGIVGSLGMALAIILSNGVVSRLDESAYASFVEAKPMSNLEHRCREADPVNAAGCRFGDLSRGDEPSVAVWGDSHAGAWLPGIDMWLRRQGHVGTAFVKSGCPPLIGLKRAGTAVANRECPAWNDAVLERLERSDIEVVILVGRWPLSYHGSRVRPEPGSPVQITLRQGERVLEGSDAMKASLDSTLASLRASGIKVMVIGSVPEIGWSVPERYLDSDFFGSGMQYHDPITADVKDRIGPVDELLARRTAVYGATFVPAFSHFCSSTCLTSVDGHLLYRDDDHLSEFGARIMMPRLLESKRLTGLKK